MRRLTSIKKSRSPPPSYSMDNPVFEDGTAATPVPAPASPALQPQMQHVHIRLVPQLWELKQTLLKLWIID